MSFLGGESGTEAATGFPPDGFPPDFVADDSAEEEQPVRRIQIATITTAESGPNIADRSLSRSISQREAFEVELG
ncbi:MAG: hypothetical protein ACKVT0_23950 [Planctomycetaceae bacterium]